MNENLLQELILLERMNHSLKIASLDTTTVENFKALKDKLLINLLQNTPKNVDIQLLTVPVYEYGAQTKDKAGDLMRSDKKKKSFNYYLTQIEPSSDDKEIKEKELIEIHIDISGIQFNFQIEQAKLAEQKINTMKAKSKKWLSHQEQFAVQMQVLNNLARETSLTVKLKED